MTVAFVVFEILGETWLQERNNTYLIVFTAAEAVARRWSVKKVFVEISQNSQENTCTRVSFFIKLQASTCSLNKKKVLAQVFSCVFWKISKNTFSYRIPPVAASRAGYWGKLINLLT